MGWLSLGHEAFIVFCDNEGKETRETMLRAGIKELRPWLVWLIGFYIVWFLIVLQGAIGRHWSSIGRSRLRWRWVPMRLALPQWAGERSGFRC